MGSWSYTLKEVEIIPYSKEAGTVLVWNATKTIVSGWELMNTRVNVTYWNAYNKARTDTKPSEDQYQQSFTEMNVWLQLRRHAPYFGVLVLLPAVMSSFFTLAAFWTVTAVQGVSVLLVNILVQAVFTDDLLQKIPPSTGGIPRIGRYSGMASKRPLSLRSHRFSTLLRLQSDQYRSGHHSTHDLENFRELRG